MIDVVAGTRPNLVKVAPILREMKRRGVAHRFVWTAQHEGALDIRDELGMPEPDVQLNIGGIAHAEYLEQIKRLLGQQWRKEPRPKCVVVVGDVTSTLAAALAAVACRISVVHVEAGLRSGDWEMPEERNRIIVDEIAGLCLTTELSAVANLPRTSDINYEFVGNVMIDSLYWARRNIEGGMALETDYALVTLHRPSNVDYHEDRTRTMACVGAILREGLDVVWPMHPRVADRLAPNLLMENAVSVAVETLKLRHPELDTPGRGTLRVMPPAPYKQMVRLIQAAKLVATDSGGVQEETTALGVPCLTLRKTTERPITVTVGTNEVVGLDPARVTDAVHRVLLGRWKTGAIPEGWDGHAAERIVEAILRRYP